MDIVPLNEWIVVEAVSDSGKVGSLFTPETSTADFVRGKILAISLAAAEKLGVHEGVTILYDRLGHRAVRSGDRSVLMLKANEVMGFIRP